MSITPSEKMHLRERLRAERNSVSPEDAAAASQAVRDQFLENVPLEAGSIVAGTWPLPGEADPRPLMEALHTKGHALGLPIMSKPGEPLTFRAYAPGDALITAAFGVQEPGPDQPTLTPELVLTPLIAVDRAGNRLGQGGGFYDRTIKQLRQSHPKIRFIGLAFAMQLVDSLPHDSFDQPLDGVVTEAGVTLFS